MDVVALVEILASIANSQVEGGEEEEQTAEAGQEEEEEEGREETEVADIAALLTGKPRIRAEETAPMPVSCSEDKILLARLLGISTKGNKIPFSGDNVLPDSIPRRPHRVRKRLASGRGKLAAGIADMCTASSRCVVILRTRCGSQGARRAVFVRAAMARFEGAAVRGASF